MSELPLFRRRRFPNLGADKYEITSPETDDYNCVAWALGRTDSWIEPADEEIDSGDRPLYLTWALRLLAAHGFQPTDDLRVSDDVLAVFADPEQFTHVARRLPNGRWTSKLGDWQDIEHEDLASLEGGDYGSVVAMLSRRGETQ